MFSTRKVLKIIVRFSRPGFLLKLYVSNIACEKKVSKYSVAISNCVHFKDFFKLFNMPFGNGSTIARNTKIISLSNVDEAILNCAA